ncbi:hypothetical protein BH11MYX3_BH11MYX3_24960 [soil metagenome]
MAKRSPILGYNHNVLYRGLVFHVQTEDSGQASPHLFTHLFHGGVIISTRKLVYDAGSAEESIKGLMQAQHKVVLKDLKKGTFDDKIDVYLVGTEGLLPRTSVSTAPAAATASAAMAPVGTAEVPAPPEGRMSEPLITMRPATEELDSIDAVELIEDRPSEPQIFIEEGGPALSRTATPPPLPRGTAQARTRTAERKSAPTAVRTTLPTAPPPSPDEIDPPTDHDVDPDDIAAALNATVRTPMANLDSAPEISIKLDLEDPEDDQPGVARTRSRHDTEVESDGVPGSGRRPGDSAAPPIGQERRPTGDRQTALGAAALPPARPISRPPSRHAIMPPAVMSRPVAQDDRSDSVEVYAPAPPSVEPPPGERSERPGQYAQHKRPSARVPTDAIKNERSGSIPIPAGLSRPGRASVPAPAPGTQPPPNRAAAPAGVPAQPRAGTPSSQPIPRARTASQSSPVPRPQTGSQPPPPSDRIARGRTTTPSRVSPPSGAAQPRLGTQSGGVVMTRPAVIVGAPAKPSTPPRVRKAREEEGSGFGQGLISEKSLDEVILAYLSEDADEK